jgi:hypothetical protein
MRRFAALVAAALALAPTPAIAKSGYVRLPEPRLVRAGVPIPDLQLSPSQILGGCGPKRVRDQITHKCRGPADIGN